MVRERAQGDACARGRSLCRVRKVDQGRMRCAKSRRDRLRPASGRSPGLPDRPAVSTEHVDTQPALRAPSRLANRGTTWYPPAAAIDGRTSLRYVIASMVRYSARFEVLNRLFTGDTQGRRDKIERLGLPHDVGNTPFAANMIAGGHASNAHLRRMLKDARRTRVDEVCELLSVERAGRSIAALVDHIMTRLGDDEITEEFRLSGETAGGIYPFPRARRDEGVCILTFNVEGTGWKIVRDALGDERGPVRLLARLPTRDVFEDFAGAKAKKRRMKYCADLHAKAVIYTKQRCAVIGSFNITGRSLTQNIETYVAVRGETYEWLRGRFEDLWRQANDEFPRFADDDPEVVGDYLDKAERIERLYPFQEKLSAEVTRYLTSHASRSGRGRVLELPTGAGKTLIIAEAIGRSLRPEDRVLWVSHRREILRQAYRRVRAQLGQIPREDYFIRPDILDPDRTDREELKAARGMIDDARVVFLTQSQSLLYDIGERPYSIVVVDECHRYHENAGKTYGGLEEHVRDWGARRLGLTGTVPPTNDKRGFDGLWLRDAIIGSDITKARLQGAGILSRTDWDAWTRTWRVPRFHVQLDRALRESRGGSVERSDALERALEGQLDAFNCPAVNGAVAEAFRQYSDAKCPCKRVLCFATKIVHARALGDSIADPEDPDAPVRCVHSDMSWREIRRSLDWFKADPEKHSETRMLVSVLMLTEGVDLPKVDCLFMVRPTFSPILHGQMLGRGLRGPKVGGTDYCAVVDFTYMFVDEHGDAIDRGNQVTMESYEDRL